MSIDLEWSKLDASLSTKLVDILNKQLSATTKPSFIGPVEVTGLEFGTAAPDVELVDLRDIYRDFLEDEEDVDEDSDPVKVTEGADEDDGFEWPHPQPQNSASDSDTDSLSSPSPPPPPPSQSQPALQEDSGRPNLQLHFRVNWQSDLRITLTTSLLINYPSPMFMSLPIKLSVTGLVFDGEIAVAYEGERNRVHLCILDELDPYGPAGDRPKRETPPEPLLPSIFIESEIGQADKHVLKNVTRVERFIQDVIRKTVEEELVFPNFHTLVMGG
ncbi:hypothetical protein L218DRAFT_852213 [Marasmius fiardii PR-910]|nr:hypothetical protein L218DRAFT_852213 [Marasmius fiardii PR-910]